VSHGMEERNVLCLFVSVDGSFSHQPILNFVRKLFSNHVVCSKCPFARAK
jgi:hypothetical protein